MCSGANIGSVGTLPNGAMKKVVILDSRWLCGGTGSGSVGLRCCLVSAPLSRRGRQRRRLGAAAVCLPATRPLQGRGRGMLGRVTGGVRFAVLEVDVSKRSRATSSGGSPLELVPMRRC